MLVSDEVLNLIKNQTTECLQEMYHQHGWLVPVILKEKLRRREQLLPAYRAKASKVLFLSTEANTQCKVVALAEFLEGETVAVAHVACHSKEYKLRPSTYHGLHICSIGSCYFCN